MIGSTISNGEARRLALTAQGFAEPLPSGRVDIRHFRRIIRQIGLLQLDSVQAVCRSHFLPIYSRLGLYDRDALESWLWYSGEMFEAWSHEASILPVEFEPLLRWSKLRARSGPNWDGSRKLTCLQERYIDSILQEVQKEAPLRARDLKDPRPRTGTWWEGRSDGLRALDWLFRVGDVGVTRTRNFEKQFHPLTNLLPEKVKELPTPSEHEAQRSLLEAACRFHGVGTVADLSDYFRLRVVEARPRLAELVEQERLIEVAVEGWQEPAFKHPDVKSVQKVETRTLLSPFDPLIWFRPRAERLFDFKYRLEIYVPEKRRKYGYYVLPFLLGDALVARVDLRVDRANGRLSVVAAYGEEGIAKDHVAFELSAELKRLASFLGLTVVDLGTRGDLIGSLRKAHGEVKSR